MSVSALLLVGCSARPPTPRLPTVAEASPEVVVVNYAPRRLRLLPDRGSDGTPRYVALGTERPGLVAAWRALAVVDRSPPPGFVARAGDLAWVAGRVVEAQLTEGQAVLLAYDRDARRPSRVPLLPPGPCAPAAPPLLMGDGDQVHGALRCAGAEQSYLFSADADGQVTRWAAAPLAAELALHAPEGDYVLGARAVALLAPGADGGVVRAQARLPGPGGDADARELLLGPEEVVVVEAAGRLLRLARISLAPRGEVHFPPRRTQRLRAALAGDHVIAVVAERRAAGTELFGLRLPLHGGRPGTPLLLGSGPAESDHEVVPVHGSGVRALLLRTHEGNTGPLVALVKLGF